MYRGLYISRMTQQNPILNPLQLGNFTLKNRVIMAPLTRMRAKMPGNIPWPLNAEYYAQRAGAGLIISEATPISPMGHGYYATPGIHTTEQIEGWKLVTKAVHDAGGLIFLQLWHVGRQSHPDLLPGGALPVAPSAISPGGQAPTATGMKDRPVPRALSLDEIPQIVEDYRHAAANAKLAGFDGVEIHAANGYLLDQFLSDQANVRTDIYGGSVENRARLTLEVVRAVLREWNSRQVGIRLSPSGTFGEIHHTDRWAQYSYVVERLREYHLAYIHLVEPRAEGARDKPLLETDIELDRFKPLIGPETCLIAAGGHTHETANQAIASGVADAVAFGRWIISNPDLADRFCAGAELTPYDRDTFYGGTEKGYTDYPFMDASKKKACA